MPPAAVRALPALFAATVLPSCAASPGATPNFAGGSTHIGDFSVPVQSVEDRRFATVIRQQYDFSCGSAALATLLHHHYGSPQGEAQVFRGMWAEGDRAQIRRLGFSLLDMKRYLATLGYQADGFEVTLDEVAKAGVPGIALINLNGYRHFVVVKGVSRDEVLVGDPSLGLKPMPAADFSKAWNGVYFALGNDLKRARSNFNRDAQWANFSRAPVREDFTNPMSQQALMLTAPSYQDF